MKTSGRKLGKGLDQVILSRQFHPKNQDAFMRAIVAVVLKPGTISASTTVPP